jgi:hypothetical protein
MGNRPDTSGACDTRAARAPPTRWHCLYEDARAAIRNGDLLLWRPTGYPGRAICRWTGEKYSHAALAGWDGSPKDPGSVLRCLEFLQWYGGRAVNLSRLVCRFPGVCDVYRFSGEWQACHHIGRHQAVLRMSRRMGDGYGWRDFFRVGYRRVMRRLLGPALARHVCVDLRDDRLEDSTPMICSQAVAWAWDLEDWLITPGDLARLAEYQFTIGGVE